MTAPDCRSPATCPVPSPTEINWNRLSTTTIQAGEFFYNVYSTQWADSLFNPSAESNARFSPLTADTDETEEIIPTLYLARRQTTALLETVFHEITATGPRNVSTNATIRGRGMRTVNIPSDIRLADLRNPALTKLTTKPGGTPINRQHAITSNAAHYPCTRQWAQTIRTKKPGGQTIQGIIWQSRVAEIAQTDSRPLITDLLNGNAADVIVLFADQNPSTLADYQPITIAEDLTLQGSTGAKLIDDVINQLNASLEP